MRVEASSRHKMTEFQIILITKSVLPCLSDYGMSLRQGEGREVMCASFPFCFSFIGDLDAMMFKERLTTEQGLERALFFPSEVHTVHDSFRK